GAPPADRRSRTRSRCRWRVRWACDRPSQSLPAQVKVSPFHPQRGVNVLRGFWGRLSAIPHLTTREGLVTTCAPPTGVSHASEELVAFFPEGCATTAPPGTPMGLVAARDLETRYPARSGLVGPLPRSEERRGLCVQDGPRRRASEPTRNPRVGADGQTRRGDSRRPRRRGHEPRQDLSGLPAANHRRLPALRPLRSAPPKAQLVPSGS